MEDKSINRKQNDHWLLLLGGDSQPNNCQKQQPSLVGTQNSQTHRYNVIVAVRKPESVSVNRKCMNDSQPSAEEEQMNESKSEEMDFSQEGGSLGCLQDVTNSIELKVEDDPFMMGKSQSSQDNSRSGSPLQGEEEQKMCSATEGRKMPSHGVVHQRMSSDYINQDMSPAGLSDKSTTNPSSKMSPSEELLLQRQIFLDKMLIGNQLCQSENYEEALHEYMSLVQSPIVEVNPAFKAVLFYNQACCFHRLQMIPDCIEAMREALITLEDESLMMDSVESAQDEVTASGYHVLVHQVDYPYAQSQFQRLCEKLTFERVMCRFTLQLCAIMSQSSNHSVALELATKADHHAQKMIQHSHKLCNDYLTYLQTINRQQSAGLSGDATVSSGDTKIIQQNESQVIEGSESVIGGGVGGEDDYTPKFVKDQSGYFNNKQEVWQNLRRSSESTYNDASNYKIFSQQQNVNNASEIGHNNKEQSFVTQKSNTSNQSSATKTSIKIKRRSSTSKNKDQNNDQSLERVHTFHLKKSPSNESRLFGKNLSPSQINQATPITSKTRNINLFDQNNSKNTQQSKTLNNKSVLQNDRVFYVQENTRAHDDVVTRNIQPVINELVRLLQLEENRDDNDDDNYAPNQKHIGYKSLRDRYRDEGEIERQRIGSHRFKLSIRSVLGLPKSSLSGVGKNMDSNNSSKKRDEQWIYHLNIGNVMYLQQIEIEDLLKLEVRKRKTFGDSGIVEGSPYSNIKVLETYTHTPQRMALLTETTIRMPQTFQVGRQTPSLDDIIERIKKELSKDEILDKLVLLVSGLFCMGTELRFKFQTAMKDPDSPQDVVEQIRSNSERCHANALHLSSIFLPDECPLVTHMINSYKKHHLKNRPLSSKQQKTISYESQQIGKTESESLQSIHLSPQPKQKVIEISLQKSPNTNESNMQEVNKRSLLIERLMTGSSNNLSIQKLRGQFNDSPNVILSSQNQSKNPSLNKAKQPINVLKLPPQSFSLKKASGSVQKTKNPPPSVGLRQSTSQTSTSQSKALQQLSHSPQKLDFLLHKSPTANQQTLAPPPPKSRNLPPPLLSTKTAHAHTFLKNPTTTVRALHSPRATLHHRDDHQQQQQQQQHHHQQDRSSMKVSPRALYYEGNSIVNNKTIVRGGGVKTVQGTATIKVVQREFGGVKRPRDSGAQAESSVVGGQEQKSTTAVHSSTRLDEMLSQFDKLRYQTLSAKKIQQQSKLLL